MSETRNTLTAQREPQQVPLFDNDGGLDLLCSVLAGTVNVPSFQRMMCALAELQHIAAIRGMRAP